MKQIIIKEPDYWDWSDVKQIAVWENIDWMWSILEIEFKNGNTEWYNLLNK